MKDNVRLVVLNACYSKEQAEAIIDSIDCAIGMKTEIGDDAAIRFAAQFYSALGFGLSVKTAFDQGTANLALHGLDKDNEPMMLSKTGVDASKVILVKADGADS